MESNNPPLIISFLCTDTRMEKKYKNPQITPRKGLVRGVGFEPTNPYRTAVLRDQVLNNLFHLRAAPLAMLGDPRILFFSIFKFYLI